MFLSSKTRFQLSFIHIFFRNFGRLSLLLTLVAAMIFFSPLRKPPVPPRQLVDLPEESYPYQCPSTRFSPLYIFLHLHKTAGNSLKRSLFAFAVRNNLTLFHTCHTSKSQFSSLWIFNSHKIPGSLDCNLDVVHDLSPRSRAAINIIVGHQIHGAHTLFRPRPVRYFTFVRHPVFRKTSHFYHFESPNASLAEYLLTNNRNYMTKRLATREPLSELSLQIRSRIFDMDPFALNAALEAAMSHVLTDYFFIGLQERHVESLCVLSRILNRACRTGFDNTGPATRLVDSFPLVPRRMSAESENIRGFTNKAVQRLPLTVLRKTLRAEAADVKLYQFAQQLFEAKLANYPECRLPVTPLPLAWQRIATASA